MDKHDKSVLRHIKPLLSPQPNKERILRKTLEVIERPVTQHVTETQKTFTTEPKSFRIRRGHTIVIRRCKQIMKHLWQMGFRHGALVRREPIGAAIFYCAGGDYRTIKKYLGFRRVLRKGNYLNPPQTIYVPGYLERLHYFERAKQGNYRLCHEAVSLPYHYEEGLFLRAPLGPNSECASSKEVLCVRREAEESKRFGYGEGPMGPTNNLQQQQHNTHTNQLSESNARSLTPEEQAILKATLGDEPDRGRFQYESKFCRDCGRAISTGSQIWFECPIDKRWRTVSDVCDQNG